jgi:beta-mannosidase
MNQLRKMQASFAWDWGLAAPSMGIWKGVELEVYDSLLIRDVTFDLFDEDSNWKLNFSVYVESGKKPENFEGVLTYQLISVIGPLYEKFLISTDENGKAILKLNLTIPKKSVNLWWPNGFGSQSIYEFKVRWEDNRINSVNFFNRLFFVTSKSIHIGFRKIQLVQNQMDNGLSFFFRVNGVEIFMKGSNWIPSHILPEKGEENVKELLEAARKANMNMLRVWGGGVYESELFYSTADKLGILIWHDMMFACAMYPAGKFLENVKTEINQQVRRIQHHPSIALFATNNENEVALRQNWYGTEDHYRQFAEVKTLIEDLIFKIFIIFLGIHLTCRHNNR